MEFKKEVLKPNQLLSNEELSRLNRRSNRWGLIHLTLHLIVLGASGYLWLATGHSWWIRILALPVYGFSIASMFAVVHECCHRTAFSSRRLNDVIAWSAGVLSFYNSSFYRLYHRWHHRYTRIEGRDPELEDPKPSNLKEYLIELCGYNWWRGKLHTHYRVVTGQLEDFPYISSSARNEVIRSTRLHMAVYGSVLVLSILYGQPLIVTYWLLPLVVGQPILRTIFIAEHRGCSLNDNLLTNTRTTKTWWLVRFLMWNMPFHAEHHLYPSIPFHQLPNAHKLLHQHFTHVELGYLRVNQSLIEQNFPA